MKCAVQFLNFYRVNLIMKQKIFKRQQIFDNKYKINFWMLKNKFLIQQDTYKQDITTYKEILIRSQPTYLMKKKSKDIQIGKKLKVVRPKSNKKTQIQIKQKSKNISLSIDQKLGSLGSQEYNQGKSVKLQDQLLKLSKQNLQLKTINQKMIRKFTQMDLQLSQKKKQIQSLQQKAYSKSQLHLKCQKVLQLQQTIRFYQDLIDQKQATIRKIIKFNDFITERLIAKQQQLSKASFLAGDSSTFSTCDKSKGHLSAKCSDNFSLQLEESIKQKFSDQNSRFSSEFIIFSQAQQNQLDRAFGNQCLQKNLEFQLNQVSQRECITFGN